MPAKTGAGVDSFGRAAWQHALAQRYFDSRRMVSSSPLSDSGNMRLPMSCWMMLMLWRYCPRPGAQG